MGSLEGIKKIEEKFSRLYNEKDFQGAAEMYTKDGILVPPQCPRLDGIDAIRDFLKQFHNSGAVKLEVTVQFTNCIDEKNTLEFSNFTFFKEDGTIFIKGRWMTYWVKEGDEWLCKLDTLSPL